MNIARKILVLLMAILMPGCAPSWVRVDDASLNYKGEYFSLTLPPGWMKIEDKHGLLLSRDGPDLQFILIQHIDHQNAFYKLKKSSSPVMLPTELAELYIAEQQAGGKGGLSNLQILKNEPVRIAGHTGFALHLTFKTDRGLRIEMLVRGCVDEKGLYLLSYRAPKLHYFDRDIPEFEMVVQSFRP